MYIELKLGFNSSKIHAHNIHVSLTPDALMDTQSSQEIIPFVALQTWKHGSRGTDVQYPLTALHESVVIII